MRFWTEKRILWGIILVYIAVFGVITSLRHYQFVTQTWDMGAFVQTFWNTINGRVMQNNIEQAGNHLGIHWTPFLFLLVPGYFIFQSPYFLLVIQTIALALGALPLYFLARKILNPKWALAVAAAYLLYPSLHWANTFDFHELIFLTPLLLAAFYFAEEKRWGWAALFAVLSASVREDAILAVVFFGLYLLIKKGSFSADGKRGTAVAVLAAVYLALTLKVFMPAFAGGELLRFDRYQHLGATPAEAVKTVLTRPALVAETVFTWPKIRYVIFLLLPVAFLPLFSGRALILLIPGLAENLLTDFPLQFSGQYQYDSVLIAGVFVASIHGLKNILARKPGWTKPLFYSFLSAAAIGFLLRSPVSIFNFPLNLFKANSRNEVFRKLVSIVPPGISVSAHTNLVPHLSHREHAYMLGKEPFLTDMVIVDGADSFGFPDAKSFQNYIKRYDDSGNYNATVVDNRYLVILNKKFRLEGL